MERTFKTPNLGITCVSLWTSQAGEIVKIGEVELSPGKSITLTVGSDEIDNHCKVTAVSAKPLDN